MKKRIIQMSIFVGLGLLLWVTIYFQGVLVPHMVINEVSFQNNEGNDWIELYNPGITSKNLKGMYLTDNREESQKFRIDQDIAISAGGFLLIGGSNTDSPQVSLKTNFGLKNGETLYLIAENGVTVVDTFSLVLEDDSSSNTVGRFPDGGEEFFSFTQATPNASNDKDEL